METTIADAHNSQAYWDNTYSKEITFGIDNRSDPIGFDMYMSIIRPGDRVLDFGAGFCHFLLHLTKHMWVEAYGVDQSEIALEHAFKENNELRLVTDLTKLPFPLQHPVFDVITCIHTAEHFKEPDKLIRKLLGYVKPGGHLVFTLPVDDQEWAEHYKIWSIGDVVDFVEQFNLYYKMIYRKEVVIPPGFRGYTVPTKLGHPNGEPIKHAIIYLRK